MDREAWRATSHEVTKSGTRLSDWTIVGIKYWLCSPALHSLSSRIPCLSHVYAVVCVSRPQPLPAAPASLCLLMPASWLCAESLLLCPWASPGKNTVSGLPFPSPNCTFSCGFFFLIQWLASRSWLHDHTTEGPVLLTEPFRIFVFSSVTWK